LAQAILAQADLPPTHERLLIMKKMLQLAILTTFVQAAVGLRLHSEKKVLGCLRSHKRTLDNFNQRGERHHTSTLQNT